MARFGANLPCPCHSGQKYKRCCLPYHRGRRAGAPQTLMRARYAAYAIGLTDFIVDTTDSEGPMWQTDGIRWRDELSAFTESTQFSGLTIETVENGEGVAWVTFHAKLLQESTEHLMVERSRFRQIDSRWLYVGADDLSFEKDN